MQSSRVRTSSPRPLTRRSSKRDIPSTMSGSPFHLPPVSPTTPTITSSPFTNVHFSVPPSLTQLANQPPTPPPTPAPSPTASRPNRHMSFRRRQSDLNRKISDITREQSDLTGKQSGLTRKQSDLTRKQSGLTRKQSSLTRKQSDLARKQSSLTRNQSGLTRRQSQCQSLDTCSTESPRQVRFGGENVEYLAGDSSDEDDGFYSDPQLQSRPTVTSPRPKDVEDARRRTRENLGHDSPRDRTAESDNDASRRGRSSSHGAPGTRNGTPFTRRGSNFDDEGDDMEGSDEARVTHGIRSDADDSTLKKSASRQGRSSSRGAPSKRSVTPFVRRSVSWEDEDEGEDKHDEDGSEKNGSVIAHASSEERSSDDEAIRRGRSVEGNDAEPSSLRPGRSSSRGSPSKRSATPFVRRSVNWDDEDDDDRVGAELEEANRSENNVQCSPHDQTSKNDDEGHVRPGRSVCENDDGPPSSRGRSSSRGARTKRSATPFVKRNIYWADEDEDDCDENDARSAKAKVQEYSVVQTGNNMSSVRRSVDRKDERVEKVERFGLAVIPEIEECVTIVEDEDEKSVGQQGTDAVRQNSTDKTERGKETHHQATILDNGDLRVIMSCSCGQEQILTYSLLTGIDIKPC